MLQGELAVLDKMEAAGVFLSEVRYYRFERMYLLGMKECRRTLGAAVAMDGKQLFAAMFLAKTVVRKLINR